MECLWETTKEISSHGSERNLIDRILFWNMVSQQQRHTQTLLNHVCVNTKQKWKKDEQKDHDDHHFILIPILCEDDSTSSSWDKRHANNTKRSRNTCTEKRHWQQLQYKKTIRRRIEVTLQKKNHQQWQSICVSNTKSNLFINSIGIKVVEKRRRFKLML